MSYAPLPFTSLKSSFVGKEGKPCRHSLAEVLVTLSRGFNLILRKSAISLSSSCSLGRQTCRRKEGNKARPIISVLRKMKQEEHYEIKVTLKYIVRLSFKIGSKKRAILVRVLLL